MRSSFPDPAEQSVLRFMAPCTCGLFGKLHWPETQHAAYGPGLRSRWPSPDSVPTLMLSLCWGDLSCVLAPQCQRSCLTPCTQRLPTYARLQAGGALIGPHALGIVKDVEGVRHLAELGVVFLLFNIGLELSLDRLRSMQKFVFGLGSAQARACVLAFLLQDRSVLSPRRTCWASASQHAHLRVLW